MESIGTGFVSLGQTGVVVSRSGFDVVGGSCTPSSDSVMNSQICSEPSKYMVTIIKISSVQICAYFTCEVNPNDEVHSFVIAIVN